MVILDEVKRRLSELAPEVTDLHDALAIERSRGASGGAGAEERQPGVLRRAAASGAVFCRDGAS